MVTFVPRSPRLKDVRIGGAEIGCPGLLSAPRKGVGVLLMPTGVLIVGRKYPLKPPYVGAPTTPSTGLVAVVEDAMGGIAGVVRVCGCVNRLLLF
tara:strand:+ start:3129 stop:3413 length:285 start_codon:yes stop_codon:yes gene_type:complete